MSETVTGFRALTANLGRCSRGTGTAERAIGWLADPWLRDYELLFLQECPDLELLASAFEVVVAETGPTYRCRSAVAVRRDSGLVATAIPLRTADYHGSYVAAAKIEGLLSEPVTCLSVHASPTALTAADRASWERIESLPAAREGGGPDANTLWDADLVHETLAGLKPRVLAAGDWNEARAWDDLHPGQTWGLEFFERMKEAGLVDVPHRDWEGERVTREPYQLDHVFASSDIAKRVHSPEVVYSPERIPADHKPIEFFIGGQRASEAH